LFFGAINSSAVGQDPYYETYFAALLIFPFVGPYPHPDDITVNRVAGKRMAQQKLARQ
jgi:hypothetical protein